ncbi:unnamed protein product [Parajaminaea phylloscopi]
MSVHDSPHPHISRVDASSFNYRNHGWQHIAVDLQQSSGILTVTLNRPDRHNAFSNQMMHSLVFAYELAHKDDRVKVVVLTGAGKSFCAGADLTTDGFGVTPGAPITDHRDGGGKVVLAMINCSKLIIAAVNGNAVGIGLTMTFPADLRICAESAKLATPFVKRGIPCDALSSHLLPLLVGHANASKALLTGDLLTPASSALANLWWETKPAQEVLPTAMALAERLAKETSALSVALVKSQIWRPGGAIGGQLTGGLEEVHERESMALAWTSLYGDAAEGVKSFMQKRPASFGSSLQKLRESGFWPWWTLKDVSGKGTRAGAKL